MPERHYESFKLPSGASIEIETILDRCGGPSDVSPKKQLKEIAFEEVIEPLGEISTLVFEKLKTSVKTPSSIEVELGASIKGQTKLVIVSGEGQASIKVKLTWKNME